MVFMRKELTYLRCFFALKIMKLFGRKSLQTETVCKYCSMEFAESERMLRHMIKAHSKINKNKN